MTGLMAEFPILAILMGQLLIGDMISTYQIIFHQMELQ